jgi:hypothetical protein
VLYARALLFKVCTQLIRVEGQRNEPLGGVMGRRHPLAGLRISVRMLCSEYSRLLRHYEAALRRWAQAEWSSNKNESDPSWRLSAGIRKEALDEREAAKQL